MVGKVLVVEDEELLLSAIVKKLTLASVPVVACRSALQAWDNLENMGVVPKVIWLDYYLPDSNGLEFMQRLRRDKRWKEIPVVMVSNSASLDKISQMKELGVKTFFVKSDSRLEDIVKRIKDMASAS